MKLRSGRRLVAVVKQPKRKRKATSTRKVARQEAKRVMNANTELRHYQHHISASGGLLASTCNIWHTIGQDILKGTDYADRHGAKIKVEGLNIKIGFQNTSATRNGWYRVMLVKRTKPNAGIERLFTNTSADIDGTSYNALGDIKQIWQLLNKTYFKPVFDRRYRFLANLPTSVGRDRINRRVKIRFKHKLNYTEQGDLFKNTIPNYVLLSFFQMDDSDITTTCQADMVIDTFFRDM